MLLLHSESCLNNGFRLRIRKFGLSVYNFVSNSKIKAFQFLIAELISTSSTTEEDVVWEPVTAKSQMGHRSPSRIDSCRKPDLKKLKAQENLYDDIGKILQ